MNCYSSTSPVSFIQGEQEDRADIEREPTAALNCRMPPGSVEPCISWA